MVKSRHQIISQQTKRAATSVYMAQALSHTL
jgi:hypothetical protein